MTTRNGRAASGRIVTACLRALWPAIGVCVAVALAGGGRAAVPAGWAAYVLVVAFRLRHEVPFRCRRG